MKNWQNAQSLHYNQILPKSLPARLTPTHVKKTLQQKYKKKLTNIRIGQLVTNNKSG